MKLVCEAEKRQDLEYYKFISMSKSNIRLKKTSNVKSTQSVEFDIARYSLGEGLELHTGSYNLATKTLSYKEQIFLSLYSQTQPLRQHINKFL